VILGPLSRPRLGRGCLVLGKDADPHVVSLVVALGISCLGPFIVHLESSFRVERCSPYVILDFLPIELWIPPSLLDKGRSLLLLLPGRLLLGPLRLVLDAYPL
jgi:hypothetical protein